MSTLSRAFFNSLKAPKNVFPLSLESVIGIPRLAVNQHIAFINEPVVRFGQFSKINCSSCRTSKKNLVMFLNVYFVFNVGGAKKSTLVLVNAKRRVSSGYRLSANVGLQVVCFVSSTQKTVMSYYMKSLSITMTWLRCCTNDLTTFCL